MNYLLIGKSNVGKSSLFNILTNSYNNIVHPEAGTTRDWHRDLIKESTSFIFDTPGILIGDNNTIDHSIKETITNKIDILLYVVDYNEGYNQIDHLSISKLRKFNKKIVLIVNKFDNYKTEPFNFFSKYGIHEILYISCTHRYGIKNLKSLINISKNKNINQLKHDFSIAIFGKPNVGKSTFLNSLIGYNRALTNSKAGTTSDYIIEYFNYKKKCIKVIDTAGIGKKSNIINKSINYYSVKKTFKNIAEVDSSLIIIDSSEGIDRQDKRIINLISNKSKSIILIFNKLDLIKDKINFKIEIIKDIKNSISEIKNIKILFISSLKKKNVTSVIKYLYDYVFINNDKISTSILNVWLKKSVKEIQHPLIENKKVNFKYAVQVKEKPLTIKIFCNYSKKLKNNYKRYLINNFNYHFKILNQKTKFIFSSSNNPYI